MKQYQAVRGESGDGIRATIHPRGAALLLLQIWPDILSRRALPTGCLAALGARRHFHHGLLWTTTLFAILLSGRAAAITVVPLTFEELVDEAGAVVYARVADVRGQWTDDRRAIDSLITLEALRYLKGDLGPTVLMRLPGGEAGGVLNVLPGAPVLREGDLVVIFLATRGPSIPSTVGLGQGIFRVIHDTRSGAMLVTPPPLKASPAGRVIRGAADRRLLTLDRFHADVRGLGAAR